MVTTRSQVIGVNHKAPRSGRDRAASLPKRAQATKTIVQKRHQAIERKQEPANLPHTSVRAAHVLAPHLGNYILFLFVGEQRQLVTIHYDLLPEATKAYIQEKNVGQHVYQLPDEDLDIVQVYRLFLYTNRTYSISEANEDRPDNGIRRVHADAEWTKLAHVFAKTVHDEKFANACITAIIEKMTEIDRYPTGIASEVYSFTSQGDNLRRLIVDVHVYKGLGHWVRPPHDDAEGPVQFLQGVITGLAAAGSEVYDDDVMMPWEASGCTYHSHEVTERCE